MTQTRQQFEVTFIGGAVGEFPAYKREHKTLEAATAEAVRVWDVLDDEPSWVADNPEHVGLSSRTAAHDAIIYGPGLGVSGKRLSNEMRATYRGNRYEQ